MLDKVVLGTVQFGLSYGINNTVGKPTTDQVFDILNYAFDAGIASLDTANAYGNAIKVIGDFHRKYGKYFLINSKFHVHDSDLSEAIKLEARELNIDYFNTYSFHSYDDFLQCPDKLSRQLTGLKQQGVIRKIGISVYTNVQFEKAIESGMIDVIQFPYNMLDNLYHRGELIERAKLAGKELHIRSVFLQGLFFMQENEIPDSLSKLKPYLNELKEIQAACKADMEELALAYVLLNPQIDKVLFGIETLSQLKRNICSIDKLNEIDGQFLARINNIHVKETELLNPVNWKKS